MARTTKQRKLIACGLLIVLVSSPIAILWYIHQPESVESIPLAMQIPSFIVSTLDGIKFSLNYRGKKHVLIFFTAECSSCRVELSNIDFLQKNFKAQIDFFALSLSKMDATKLLIATEKYSFPIFQAERNTTIDSMNINPPTMFFIDERRILRHRYAGDRTLENDKKLIQEFSTESFIQNK